MMRMMPLLYVRTWLQSTHASKASSACLVVVYHLGCSTIGVCAELLNCFCCGVLEFELALLFSIA